MRLDVPHLRMTESAVTADFQTLAGKILAGNKAIVVRGFKIHTDQTLNTAAEALLLETASGVLIHPLASEAGSVFEVPSGQADELLAGTNPAVVGAFVVGTNYVGVDLVRVADPTTIDSVQFLDDSGATPTTFSQTTPLGRTLQYRIHIQSTDFDHTASIAPVAIVRVTSDGLVQSITDARQLAFRLGVGGSIPSGTTPYGGLSTRLENPITYDDNNATDPFVGGDKDLASFRDWMAAVMYRIWELGGGAHWYAAAAQGDLKLTYNPAQVFVETGTNWYWTTTNLRWAGLRFFISRGDGGVYNEIADQLEDSPGLTDLGNGECLYVDVDRTADHTVAGGSALVVCKGTYASLPLPTIPGARQIIAWRDLGQVYVWGEQVPVNNAGTGAPATTDRYGTVKIYSPVAPGGDVVCPIIDFDEVAPGRVLATGLMYPGIVAGTLKIGISANDAGVWLGKSGATTKVLGLFEVTQATKLSTTLEVTQGTTLKSTLEVTAAATLHSTLTATTTGNGSLAITGTVTGAVVDNAWGLKGIGPDHYQNTASGGVMGYAPYGYGVYGLSGGSGAGVYGSGVLGVLGSGTSQGVRGTASAQDGIGVIGDSTATGSIGVKGTGKLYGVYGLGVDTSNADGVYGLSDGTGAGAHGKGEDTGSGPGVFGEIAVGTNRTAVLGTICTGAGNWALTGTGAGTAGGVKGTGNTGILGAGTILGVRGTASAQNSIGVSGDGVAVGVYGTSTNGYGVMAESDTTLPAKAALRIVPQNADPVTDPAAGDIYVHSVTGHASIYDGSSWSRVVGNNYALPAIIEKGLHGWAEGADYELYDTATIPANTVRVGTVIRVRVAFDKTTTYSGTAYLHFGTNPQDGAKYIITTPAGVSTSDDFIMEADITIQGVGANGSASVYGHSARTDVNEASAVKCRATSFAMDTTAPIQISASASGYLGTVTMQLKTFTVDISG